MQKLNLSTFDSLFETLSFEDQKSFIDEHSKMVRWCFMLQNKITYGNGSREMSLLEISKNEDFRNIFIQHDGSNFPNIAQYSDDEWFNHFKRDLHRNGNLQMVKVT